MEAVAGLGSDDGAVVMHSLRDLNTVLTLGQADVPIQPLVPALLKVMSSQPEAEAVLLAARALNLVLDIEPRSCRVLIGHDGLPVLVEKLVLFQDFEVAEQCLNMLAFMTRNNHRFKSAQYKAILRAGGLHACTAFFDIFPVHMQIKAMSVVAELASNVCDGSTNEKRRADVEKVLRILPALHSCLDTGNERVVRMTCVAVSRLTLALDKCLARDGDPEQEGQQEKSSWQVVAIRVVLTVDVARRFLHLLQNPSVAKLDTADETLLIKALGRSLRYSAERVGELIGDGLFQALDQRLGAGDSALAPPRDNGIAKIKSTENDVMHLLQLITAVIPELPKLNNVNFSSTEIESLRLSRKQRDRASSCSVDEQMGISHQGTDCRAHEEGGTGNSTTAGEAGSLPNSTQDDTPVQDQTQSSLQDSAPEDPSAFGMWACPACTFHNPLSAASCEICGQVSPKIQERAESAKASSEPSLEDLVAEDGKKQHLNIEEVWEKDHRVERYCLQSLVPKLFELVQDSSVVSSRALGLTALASIYFAASTEAIDELRGAGGAEHIQREYGVIAAALKSKDTVLERAALDLCLVDLLRIPERITPIIKREGVLVQLVVLAKTSANTELATACFALVHGGLDKSHAFEASCPVCAGNEDHLNALRELSHELLQLAKEDSLLPLADTTKGLPPPPRANPCELTRSLDSSEDNETTESIVVEEGEGSAAGPRPLRKRRSVSQPTSGQAIEAQLSEAVKAVEADDGSKHSKTSSAGEKASSSTPRLHKKRRTLSMQLDFDDSPKFAKTAHNVASISAHWATVMEKFKAMVSSPDGLTLHEIRHSGIIQALTSALANKQGRYAFQQTLLGNPSLWNMCLFQRLLSLLHAEEAFPVQRLGAVEDLQKPAYFVVKPTSGVVAELQEGLDFLAGSLITHLGTDLYEFSGFSANKGLTRLDLKLLLEPLVLVSDVQGVVRKNLVKGLRQAALQAEVAALTHVGKALERPRLNPGDLVKRGKDWSYADDEVLENEIKGEEAQAQNGVVLKTAVWAGATKQPSTSAAAVVLWMNSCKANIYRSGAENRFDIEPAQPFYLPSEGQGKGCKWRTMLGKGMQLDLLRRLDTTKDAGSVPKSPLRERVVVQTVVRLNTFMSIVLVSRLGTAEDGMATFGFEWVLSESPRLIRIGTEPEETHLRTCESETVLLESLGQRFPSSWSDLRPGTIVDMKKKSGGDWFVAVVLVGSRSPSLSDVIESPGQPWVLINDLAQPERDSFWVSSSQFEVSSPLRQTRIISNPREFLSATGPLTPSELLYFTQCCGEIVKVQQPKRKREEDAVKVGNIVYVPVHFAGKTNYVLKGTLLAIGSNDSTPRQAELPLAQQPTWIAFDGFHSIRFGIKNGQLYRFAPSKAVELTLETVEEALRKNPSLTYKCAVNRRETSSVVPQYIDRLVDRLVKTVEDSSRNFQGDSQRETRVSQRTLRQRSRRSSTIGDDDNEAGDSQSDDISRASSMLKLITKMTSGMLGEQDNIDMNHFRDLQGRDGINLRNFLRGFSHNGASVGISGNSRGGRVMRLFTRKVIGESHEAVLLGRRELSKAPLWVKSATTSSASRAQSKESSVLTKDDVLLFAEATWKKESSLLPPNKMVLEALECSTLDRGLVSPKSQPNPSLSRRARGSATWGKNTTISYSVSAFVLPTLLQKALPPIGSPIELEGSITRADDGCLSVDTRFPSFTLFATWVVSGRYYFEVEVIRSGLAQIGWASIYFSPSDEKGIGCGDDVHSWAYDGSRRQKWNVNSTSWGSNWKPGDVLGCAIDIDPRTKLATMSYALNGNWGEPLGVAFKDVPFTGPALRPVVTFNRSFRCRIRTHKKRNVDEPQADELMFAPPDPSFLTLEHAMFHVDSKRSGRQNINTYDAEQVDAAIHLNSEEHLESPFSSARSIVRNPGHRSSLNGNTVPLLSLLRDIEMLVKESGVGSSTTVDMHSRRLTQKFVLQIQDAVSVCSNSLPSWVWEMAEKFKFLLPLDARILLFETTAFGIARATERLREEISSADSTQGSGSNAGSGRGFEQQHQRGQPQQRNSMVSLGPQSRGHPSSGPLTSDDGDDGDLEEDLDSADNEPLEDESTLEEGQRSGSVSPVSPSTPNLLVSPTTQTARPSSLVARTIAATEMSSSTNTDNLSSPESAIRIVTNVDGGGRGRIANVRRQKAVVPRGRVLEAAIFLMQHNIARKSHLSVEFSGEIGHGLGPTLEFYSLVSQQLQRVDLDIWHNPPPTNAEESPKTAAKPMDFDSQSGPSQFVFRPGGLWPKPFEDSSFSSPPLPMEVGREVSVGSAKSNTSNGLADKYAVTLGGESREPAARFLASRESASSVSTHSGSATGEIQFDRPVLAPLHSKARALQLFTFVGRFIGKALQDKQLLDLPLSLPLCKLILGEPIDISYLKDVDADVGRSIEYLEALAVKFRQLPKKECAGTATWDDPAIERVFGELEETIGSLCLDFTVPGRPDDELVIGGKDMEVTVYNLEQYLRLVSERFLHDDVHAQVSAIRDGLGDFLPVEALSAFTAKEFQSMLCGATNLQNWKVDVIHDNIIPMHGYEQDSQQIKDLVQVLAELEREDQRLFLQWLTGSPRLPIGGFADLRPKLTVVRKTTPGPADEYLPSCSTCQVYLKLPAYSHKEVLKRRLLQAIRDGQGHFALD